MITWKSKRIIEILQFAGYEIHHQGIFAGGLILNIKGKGRWHAKLLSPHSMNTVEFHFDITRGGYHRVRQFEEMEHAEIARLNRFRRKFFKEN